MAVTPGVVVRRLGKHGLGQNKLVRTEATEDGKPVPLPAIEYGED